MFLSSVSLALILIATRTLAEEFPPDNDQSGKLLPTGFKAMQQLSKSVVSSKKEEMAKRAPMGFQGMRGKKDSIENSEENLLVIDDEYEKRSPTTGFLGMRGKKELILTPDFADLVNDYYKRAPMGFQGMRGKKAISDDDYYKRAAMGFQGMRGKKSVDLLWDAIDNARYANEERGGKDAYAFEYPEEYEKRAPAMGFQGMRGKRQEFEDEWTKRAPMGFQGMRGKKSLLDRMDEFEKRAMMGFQGMRGKKSVYYNEYRPVRSIDIETRAATKQKADSKIKRLNFGFLASRGKRSELDPGSDYSKISNYDFQDALINEEMTYRVICIYGTTKRCWIKPLPPLQYQHKRSAAYGYSGTRGKKIPRWEIRGKFVGVRGKKWSNNEDDSVNNFRSNNERIGVNTTNL